MADVLPSNNNRLDDLTERNEEQPGQQKLGEIVDVCEFLKFDNEEQPPSKSVQNEVAAASEKKKKAAAKDAESHRSSSFKFSGDTFEKSNTTSSVATERALGVKINKFAANSRRHAVLNECDKEFFDTFNEAIEAIQLGIYPKLIPAGSSGSYFVFDKNEQILAVFKPKDEEPFAPQNPKWPKFFQRILCFCCFGRACLIPNNGYLSEAGSSLIDDRLELNVVPKTRVVKLISPTFFYGRGFCIQKEVGPKEGSFQLFVNGYRSATEVLAEWSAKGENALTPEENEIFVTLFHKMCVLDYIIRNTDRHSENWLIRHVPDEPIQIAAIDNSLAFPVKHPECASRFRQFPFKWAELPYAKEQLQPELRERLLKLLTPLFVHRLCGDLKTLFRYDKSTSRLLSHNQVRVLRGQIWNLREGLEANESPAEWVKREPILATRRFRHSPPANRTFEECFRRLPADYSHRGCC